MCEEDPILTPWSKNLPKITPRKPIGNPECKLPIEDENDPLSRYIVADKGTYQTIKTPGGTFRREMDETGELMKRLTLIDKKGLE